MVQTTLSKKTFSNKILTVATLVEAFVFVELVK